MAKEEKTKRYTLQEIATQTRPVIIDNEADKPTAITEIDALILMLNEIEEIKKDITDIRKKILLA